MIKNKQRGEMKIPNPLYATEIPSKIELNINFLSFASQTAESINNVCRPLSSGIILPHNNKGGESAAAPNTKIRFSQVPVSCQYLIRKRTIITDKTESKKEKMILKATGL